MNRGSESWKTGCWSRASWLGLDCECVRCLKTFQYQLDWTIGPAICRLKGEEDVPVVNDCVDLTPYMREDILLEFPQHPLCEPECRGLAEERQLARRRTPAAPA